MLKKYLIYGFNILLLILIIVSFQVNPSYSTDFPALSIVRVTEGDIDNRVLALTSKTMVNEVANDDEAGTYVYRSVAGTQSYIPNSLAITNDLNLSILNQVYSYSTKTSEIDYKTERIYDYDSLTWGEARTTSGQKGEKIELWEYGSNNSKALVYEKVLKEPVNNTTTIGRKKVYLDIDKSKTRVLNVEATAYYDTITATGDRPYKGVIAVDPKVIPLYSKVYIPGYGMAIALDVGGAIKGNKIDLFFEDNSEAYVFGRRNLTIYVFK